MATEEIKDPVAVGQRFSTAGTRPSGGTWRPFYRDLKYF
jgi:hypothetical protein